jgi:tRNA dimethylallyltransferase
MTIGTAAPTDQERARIPHHLVGFLDPYERYSAARFAADATDAIVAVQARGRRAIVAGGTGFYIRALAGDVALAPARDEALRARLARESATHPPQMLWEWLALRDPARARAIDPADAYRILRALEVALAPRGVARDAASGRTLRSAGIPFFKAVLDVPMDVIDANIEHRAERMLAQGLLDEAERIGAGAVAADAVGYPQALAYLRGWSSRAELRTALVRATRRFARRQRSWFRNEPGAVWLDPASLEAAAREKLGWP